MLILQGHLCLTWFARAVGTLSPAGDMMTRNTLVPPPLWGSLSKIKPFGAPVLQECESFGSTSSSMSSLSSQGWSNTVRPDKFLHLVATRWTERVNNGCDCAAPLTILPHSPTLAGGHLSCAWTSREGRWVLCILLCMSCQVGETHLTALTGLFAGIPFLSPTLSHSTALLDPDVQVKSMRKGEFTAPADSHCSLYICLQPVVIIFICSFVNYF